MGWMLRRIATTTYNQAARLQMKGSEFTSNGGGWRCA
jgi:hypothetical protein